MKQAAGIPVFQVGIDTLLDERADLLSGRRIGLVTHAAAVDGRGRHAAQRLAGGPGRLSALFGPEHGWTGTAGPGEEIGEQLHPVLGVPVHSLYGETREPSPEMLEPLDLLVIDLQDLGFRCYTYGSTLYLVLKAAAAAGIPVVVADRPVPLPDTVDGPMLDPDCASFVGLLPAPLAHALTPGECARWLCAEMGWELELEVAEMRGYDRIPGGRQRGPPWVPPSPGIRSWETAFAYLSTVCTEALPQFACDRAGLLPFQVFTGNLDGPALAAALNARDLPGVCFEALADGVRLCIGEAAVYRPVTVAVHLLHAVQELCGMAAVWDLEGVRPEFFDQLMGSRGVRIGLQSGRPPDSITAAWPEEHREFLATRSHFLLYGAEQPV